MFSFNHVIIYLAINLSNYYYYLQFNYTALNKNVLIWQDGKAFGFKK